MTPSDRAQYTQAIQGLDTLIGAMAAEASQLDDDALAPLVGQIGAVGKAVLLLTNLLLDLAPTPPPPCPPAPLQCSFCPRPANPQPATSRWKRRTR